VGPPLNQKADPGLCRKAGTAACLLASNLWSKLPHPLCRYRSGGTPALERPRSIPYLESPSVLSRQGDSPVRFLRHVLVSVQSVLRRRAAVRSAVWASASALAALALVLAVDAVWVFAHSARPAIYLLAALAGAAGVAVSMFLAWIREPSLFYVARLIERGRPELKNDLMTFLDLLADSGADPSAAVAIARRSARLLAKFEPTRLLPPHRLRRPCAAVAGAAVALAVGVWLAQGVLFQPWIGQAEAGLVSGGSAAAALGGSGTPPVETAGAVAAQPGELAALLAPSPEPKRDGEQPSAEAAQQKEASAPGPQQAAPGALADEIAAEAGTLERLAAALEALASSPSSAPPSSADQGPAGAGQGAGRDSSQESQQGGGSEPAGSEGPTPLASAGSDETGSDGKRDGAVGGGTERTETASATGSTTGTGTGTSHQAASTGGAESQGDAAGGPAGTGAGTEQGNQGQGGTGGRSGGPGLPPIPERPQPTAFPKNPLDATRWADRLIKEADRRLREGEVSDAFLDRMGMSQADFRRFVVAWQRRLESAAPGPGATQAPGAIRTAAAPGAGEAVGASGAGLARTMVDRGPEGTPGPSNLVQDDSSQVGVRFRPVVSAYFDELSRLAEKPKSLSE